MGENKFEWNDVLVAEFAGRASWVNDAKDIPELITKFKKEKTIPLDYEILEFKAVTGAILTKNNYGFFSIYKITLDWLLSSPVHVIFSVKRLSDGEIFTIGDRCYDLDLKGKVVSIYIDNMGRCIIECDNDIPNGNNFIRWISQINKLESSPPLFTTEDGVEIRNPETDVYVLNEEWKHERIKARNVKPFSRTFFSERESKNYIVMNKPCLSASDVYELITPYGGYVLAQLKKDIIDLAQQKINNK